MKEKHVKRLYAVIELLRESMDQVNSRIAKLNEVLIDLQSDELPKKEDKE